MTEQNSDRTGEEYLARYENRQEFQELPEEQRSLGLTQGLKIAGLAQCVQLTGQMDLRRTLPVHFDFLFGGGAALRTDGLGLTLEGGAVYAVWVSAHIMPARGTQAAVRLMLDEAALAGGCARVNNAYCLGASDTISAHAVFRIPAGKTGILRLENGDEDADVSDASLLLMRLES